MDNNMSGSCLSDEQLEAMAGGQSLSSEIAAHVRACERCRGAVAEIAANDAFLARVGRKLPFGSDLTPRDPSPTPRGSSANMRSPGAAAPIGSSLLSSCRIVSEVHRGGQGIVYKALHTTTGRKVAIKTLIEGALASDQQQRRFEREMEIVANLRHPSIVTLYETGVLPDGRMAFAMEYVQGIPIDQWAKERGQRSGDRSARAVLAAKLKVFVRVCDAVQHAHQRGVIHRDLKPGNILVDADDVPHVLDFGLAKIGVHGSGGGSLEPTMTGDFRGSLAYASPEQVGRRPEAVDTRSDVYSLGAILYEIITGQRVCAAERSLAEVIRAITTEEPVPPASLCGDVDDELQTIVLCMLAKDPARRYQSAGAARDDIERYLAGAPIDAKRDSTWYVVRKAVRRHRGVAMIVSLLLVAALTTWLTASSAIAAEHQAQTVRKEVDLMQKVVQLLLDAQNPDDPWSAQVDATFSRRLLGRLAARMEELQAPPNLEATLRHELGDAYLTIDSADLAVQQLEQAVSLRENALGKDHADTIASKSTLAEALIENKQRDEAEGVLNAILSSKEATANDGTVETLKVQHLLAKLHNDQNKVPTALPESQKCLEMCTKHLGAAHELTLKSAELTVTLLRRSERNDEAHALGSRTLEIWRDKFGAEDPRTIEAMRIFSFVLGVMRRYDEAKNMLTTVHEVRERRLGQDHPKTLDARQDLAQLDLVFGHSAQAAASLRQTVETRLRVSGDTHANTIKAMRMLAEAEVKCERIDVAEGIYKKIEELYRSGRLRDSNAISVSNQALRDFGVLLKNLHRYPEAEKLLDECVQNLTKVHGKKHAETRIAIVALAQVLEQTGHSDRAEVLRKDLVAPALPPEPSQSPKK